MTRFSLLTLLAWSGIVVLSLVWNVDREQQEIRERATVEARANHNKDLSFRRWATGHGGVYVPVTEAQPPVPWLGHIQDRDVTTTDGRSLTLLNPASMLRQVMDRYNLDYGIRGRITGLKYLNPGNAPDAWERAKMLDFQNGKYQEASEMVEIDGRPHLRYLKAMYMENAGCIRCHAVLGFTRLGEFRGAIGVNVPLAPYLESYYQARSALLLSHGGFWLLGAAGILFATRRQDRLMARLAASEMHYRQIFDEAGDLILSLDAAGRLLDANPATLDKLGYSLAELQGRPLAELASEDRRAALETLFSGLAEGRPRVMETTLLTRDGHQVEVESLFSPFLEQGRVAGARAFLRDIGERKTIQSEQERMKAQLLQAQKMEALGQLTGGIAHDFNNILGAVLGYTNLTLDRYRADLPGKAEEYLLQVKQAGERARDLVAKMLAYSRGSRGEAQVMDAAPLLREVAKMLAATLPSSLELVVEIEPGVPAIRMDPVRLHQALTNLVINARDALSGQGRVRLSLHHAGPLSGQCAACHKDFQGNYVEISVADDGPGIAPEVLYRIFDPFFTTKEVGKGSGMGLAMVMGVLREVDGHVLVDAAPGKGAAFRLLIPAAA